MKTFIILLLTTGIFISCSKSHDIQLSDEILVTNDLVGKWSITQFSDSGLDKTNELSSLNIQFNSTGDFLIFKNDSTISGTWVIEPQVGLDKLKIEVGSLHLPFSIFQASWYVFDHTTNSLNLSNSSNTGSEIIQLKRI